MRVAVLDLKEPPVVGRMYLVPCIESTHRRLGWSPGLWPVIGGEHEDKQHLDFAQRHYHFDARFLSRKQVKEIRECSSNPATALFSRVFCTTAWDDSPLGDWKAPVLVERRCMRGMPDYPDTGLPRIYPAFPAVYAESKVKCGKCPHRGLPLESLPREPGTNIVTCPGHGLRWDLATGRLVQPRRET